MWVKTNLHAAFTSCVMKRGVPKSILGSNERISFDILIKIKGIVDNRSD